MSHSWLPGSDDESNDVPGIEVSRHAAPTVLGASGRLRCDLCVTVRPI